MTDLVERLRIEPTAGQFLKLSDLVQSLIDERKEAAVEIERLRKENEELEWHLTQAELTISNLKEGYDK